MQTRGRSRLLTVTLMLLAALLLAACGASGGGSPPAQPSAAPAAEPTAASAAPEATAAPAAPEPTAAPAAAQGDGELVISLNADPPRLDPAASSAFVDRQVLNNLCDKLVDLDSQGQIVPMLATEWTISDDGLTYTFTLREGVTFHDGTEFNAEAAKASIERGFAESSPRRSELSSVDTIEAVDPTTLVITLKEPFAPFLSVLSDRAGMIVSPAAAEELGENFATSPVCSGPFKFESRVDGDSITLVRNEEYWQEGLPKLAKLTFKVFTDPNTAIVNLRSGQVDFTDTVPSREVPVLSGDPSFTVVNEAGFGFQGIYLNTTQAPLDNKAVRQAVDLLIDRDALVRVVFGETATPGRSPFAPTHFAFGDSDKYGPPDVERARAILAEAGLSDVSFTLKTATSTINAQVAQLIQGFLKEGGIDMQIEQLEFGTLLEQGDAGNFQAMALGWSGRPDPDQNIYSFMVTGAANNDSRFSNATVDEQLNLARTTNDTAARKAAYDAAMAVIHDEVPYVYLYHQNNAFAMSADVQGFTYVPDGIIRAINITRE